jgi:ribonuclease HI
MQWTDSTIHIYTDGSCLGNPGPGGWAYVIRNRDIAIENHGSEPLTTNNRMEMTAAIQALRALPRDAMSVVLYSDSQLLIKTMTLGWKRKKNHDLWMQLDELCSVHRITWEWVRGHNGHVENERCDRLAHCAAKAAR